MRPSGSRTRRAFLTIVAGACLWAGCGYSPTAPSTIDPEALLREELARTDLTLSWYRGCIWQNFRAHLPSYSGQSIQFILADIRAIIAACQEAEGPSDGALEVTTSTTGEDLDADGYTLTVNGGTAEAIGANAVVTKPNLAPGDYQVELGDVAANCTVAGDNPRTIAVASGATAETTFAVTCTALPPTVGDLRVVTATGGADIDPDGYTVTVGGGAANAMGANDSLEFPGLTPGDYQVQLAGVAANCSVADSNPRTVAVAAGATAETTFTVTCTALPPTVGDLRVVTATGGADIDPDGYTVTVGGGAANAISVNDSLEFPGLTPGDYQVQLAGAAANCSVADVNPRTVSVTAGATAETTFTVTCTAIVVPGQILFARASAGIWTIDSDGSNAAQVSTVASDITPDVSPDGATLVFSSGSGPVNIFTSDIDGSNRVQLTNSTGASTFNYDPEFSPDGSKIVFYSNRTAGFHIWVMDADGSNPVRLTSSGQNGFPSWSPDGARILFTSDRDGNFEIYVMDADGSNQTRLTTNSATESRSAFSPDGTKIVFDTTRNAGVYDIYVMDADGTDQVQLTTDAGFDAYPAWSPDGQSIAFTSDRDGTADIWVMDPDGSNQTDVSQTGSDTFATWAP